MPTPNWPSNFLENQDDACLRGGLQSREKKIGRGVGARETNESFDRRAWSWFWFCFSLVEKSARFFLTNRKAQ